jgi:hypothetical protein
MDFHQGKNRVRYVAIRTEKIPNGNVMLAGFSPSKGDNSIEKTQAEDGV